MRSLATVLLLLLTLPAYAAEPFVPISVWYGGGKARAPMLEPDPRSRMDAWRADLRQIKSLGFNTVRCWIDWASAEPREGEYNFDTLDVLTDLAHEAGLRVIVQVYSETAPDWVGKKYPDSHFVSISGHVMPNEASPGYCFDHSGVREKILGLYTALAERMKTKPAFYGWDLWSEPLIISWGYAYYLSSPEFCFCPHTTGRFRDWLRAKYGTLEALNRAWYRRFESWNEVGPNRLSTILSYTDFIDWRRFLIQKLAEDLGARYRAVKQVLPNHVATSHAGAPSLFTSPLSPYGAPDDWKMAQVVDYYGTSFYPKHSFPGGRDAAWRGGLLDFARSSHGERGFYVGELQAGFGTIALRLSSTVTPADLRMWMWSSLARGAKAVNVYAWYPMSTGFEAGGFGLIELDGTITERARAAGAIGRVIDANQRLFLEARPVPAEAAIVYNPLSYMVGGRRPPYSTGAQGETAAIERNSMLGPYRALFPSSVPVDFIHIDEIAAGKASRYRMIYLPYPLMINEATGRGLRQFVENGGALVSEARLAWNDDTGRAREIIPGFGLHEVCGCRETAVQQTLSGKTEMTLSGDFAGLKAGEKIRGALYEETLTPIEPSTKVIATFPDGSPAVVESRFGKGRMLTIGTFLGNAYEIDRDETSGRFFRGLLDWAGVGRPVEVNDPNIEVRMLQSGGERLVFVFNHAAEAKTANVALRTRGTRVRDIESGQVVKAKAEGGRVTIERELPAYGVAVFSVR
ncbi:MAG TPA: beta-galactosidase [Thermoanaerobaculia bacterium]|nr:beta-galactosidase [Thermoanaerobaculia bacterium]